MGKLNFLRDVRSIWSRAERAGLPAHPGPMSPIEAMEFVTADCRPTGGSRRYTFRDADTSATWSELRWSARRRIGGITAWVIIPSRRSSRSGEGAAWAVRLARTICDFAAENPAPERAIRIAICTEKDAVRRAVRAVAGDRRDGAAIDIDFSGERPEVRAGGVAGDVLCAALNVEQEIGAALPVSDVLLACDQGLTPENIGPATASTLIWWATAAFDDSFRLFRRLEVQMPRRLPAYAALLSRVTTNGSEPSSAAVAHALEARLGGLWQLTYHFDPEMVGEEEMAGWAREIEAAARQRLDPIVPDDEGKDAPLHTMVPGQEDVWVASSPFSSVDLVRRKDAASPDPAELMDGERTLAEVIHRLRFRYGLSGSASRATVSRWLRERRARRVHRRGNNRRTALYFAYGSCMCIPSFRETVPRYDLLGPARLAGYRLAFTYDSVGRNGGVADVVEAPGDEVWGILYRIPRSYLDALDAREGVHLGHYRRISVRVEALGVQWDDVLTYTVVHKAKSEIRPSEEYAGLIVDGASLLGASYRRRLAEIFERFDVEPSLPR